jgi:hypothetical protein
MFLEKSATHFENHLLLGKTKLISEKTVGVAHFLIKVQLESNSSQKQRANCMFNEKIATHG